MAAQAMTARRFPPPWSIEELKSCFVVKDSRDKTMVFTEGRTP
jgi:hypothetical protein